MGEAGGTTISGVVTIGEKGEFYVSTNGDPVIFSGNISNANKFVVDGSITVDAKATITNAGDMTISKAANIQGQLNNLANGNVLVAAGAAGSVFATVENAGSFTNAASNVIYGPVRFTNSGVFTNNKGVTGVQFTGELVNNSTMKIDGELSATGKFTNNANGQVFVYGIADFNETVNAGTISLQPLTAAHPATVKFGNILNSGRITSLNDSRNAGDIYFKGTTQGTGTIEGFTGTLYYVYTGTEPIEQTFYSNSKYSDVTVYIGNKSVTGLDYSNGLVKLTENIAFKNLIIDGGNLTLSNGITLDAAKFEEATAGTITVENGSKLLFSNENGTTFYSSITNEGVVESKGDLVLMGTTAGNGLVNIATGKSITYAHNGSGEQALFGFVEGSSTNLIVEGSTKAIITDMTIAQLTNNGADISVKENASLTLGEVNGSASGVDGFTISTEAGGTLNIAN